MQEVTAKNRATSFFTHNNIILYVMQVKLWKCFDKPTHHHASFLEIVVLGILGLQKIPLFFVFECPGFINNFRHFLYSSIMVYKRKLSHWNISINRNEIAHYIIDTICSNESSNLVQRSQHVTPVLLPLYKLLTEVFLFVKIKSWTILVFSYITLTKSHSNYIYA